VPVIGVFAGADVANNQHLRHFALDRPHGALHDTVWVERSARVAILLFRDPEEKDGPDTGLGQLGNLPRQDVDR
jgi:hypothetical protein